MVEIVEMYPLFLKIIDNAAVVKVLSDKPPFFDKDMDIIDDVEGINDLSCWQRTKPVKWVYFIGTQFPFRTQPLTIDPIVDECEPIRGSESVVQSRECLVLDSGVETNSLLEPRDGLWDVAVFDEPMLVVHDHSEGLTSRIVFRKPERDVPDLLQVCFNMCVNFRNFQKWMSGRHFVGPHQGGKIVF